MGPRITRTRKCVNSHTHAFIRERTWPEKKRPAKCECRLELRGMSEPAYTQSVTCSSRIFHYFYTSSSIIIIIIIIVERVSGSS